MLLRGVLLPPVAAAAVAPCAAGNGGAGVLAGWLTSG